MANATVNCGREIEPTGEADDHWFAVCGPASVGCGYARYYAFTVPDGPPRYSASA